LKGNSENEKKKCEHFKKRDELRIMRQFHIQRKKKEGILQIAKAQNIYWETFYWVEEFL